MASTLPALGRGTAARSTGRLRLSVSYLVGAAVIALAVASFGIGTAWDTQWHVAVGRDQVFTAPHLMMLGGIAVAGLVSLVLILRDSVLAWRGRPLDRGDRLVLFGLFHAPLGLLVAGFGALSATIAFPLDDYWHTLYGIDVSLWAPFHMMIAIGVGMCGIGVLYLLASELHRARGSGAELPIKIGLAVVVAITGSIFMILLTEADYAEGLLQIGGVDVVLYPILLAFGLPLVLLTPARITKLPGAATISALVVVGLRQAMTIFVPWAVEATRLAEGLSYRGEPTKEVITAFAFPVWILLAALLLDLALWALRRRSDLARRTALVLGTAALTAMVSVVLDRGWQRSILEYHPTLDVDAALLTALPLALAAGLIGALGALWLARGLAGGAVLGQVERSPQ